MKMQRLFTAIAVATITAGSAMANDSHCENNASPSGPAMNAYVVAGKTRSNLIVVFHLDGGEESGERILIPESEMTYKYKDKGKLKPAAQDGMLVGANGKIASEEKRTIQNRGVKAFLHWTSTVEIGTSFTPGKPTVKQTPVGKCKLAYHWYDPNSTKVICAGTTEEFECMGPR